MLRTFEVCQVLCDDESNGTIYYMVGFLRSPTEEVLAKFPQMAPNCLVQLLNVLEW